jgi:hypothetical protein
MDHPGFKYLEEEKDSERSFSFMGRAKAILTVRPCPLWAKQHAGFGVVQK